MKSYRHVYELIFYTSDGVAHNLIFSKRSKALFYQTRLFPSGSPYSGDSSLVIVSSIIAERNLF